MITEEQVLKKIDLSHIRYIISDWDGTLVDSMSNYALVYSKLMKEKFGIDEEKSRRYYLSTSGTSLAKQIKEGAKNFSGKQINDTLELEDLFWNYQINSGPHQVIAGAAETLIKLKDKGYTVIVWSGTRTDILREALIKTNLDKFVSFAIGNEPGSNTKVKGKGLISDIANALNIPVETLQKQSIVIGDGIGDIRAGKDINCPTIGISKTQTAEVFKDEGADYVISNIKDLADIF